MLNILPILVSFLPQASFNSDPDSLMHLDSLQHFWISSELSSSIYAQWHFCALETVVFCFLSITHKHTSSNKYINVYEVSQLKRINCTPASIYMFYLPNASVSIIYAVNEAHLLTDGCFQMFTCTLCDHTEGAPGMWPCITLCEW